MYRKYARILDVNEIDRLIREQEEDDKATFYEHAIFKAPWRERLPSDNRPRYGPWYLPRSPVTGSAVSQDVALLQYAEGRYIGSAGLWDHEEEDLCTAVGFRKARKQERYDLGDVSSFVERYSAQLERKDLEVYFSYWVEGRSLKKTASHLGAPVKTVESRVRRLRKRVKNGKKTGKGYYRRRSGS